MSIEDAEEAYLWPLNVQMGFALRLEYVEDNRDSVLVVFPDDALVRVCCVWLDHATLLLRCLRRFVVLEEESLWVQYGWIFAKEECLDFNELDILILRWLWRELGLGSCNILSIFSLRFLGLATFSCCRLAIFLNWTVCVSRSWRVLCDDWWRWTTRGRLSSWWESQTLAISHIISICGRWWLLPSLREWWSLVAHIRSVIVIVRVRVDAQWVCLLTASSFVVILWGWLADPDKLGLILRTIHDLPSWWEHAGLNLVVLAHLSSSTPIWMHLITRLLDFAILLTLVDTAHALTSGTEEALHAIEIYHSLHSLRTLLLFLLNLVHLAVLLIWLLNTYIVVTKPVLLLLLGTRALDLRLKCIVNALSLRQWMIHALWTADLVHRHIGTHWHALVNLTMSSWR